ncbi:hypothetical protein [Nocardia arthritidis]|uniref:Uncharacterized protein n=1 Tax=Nocardia arthritidis TaxID=228602 RepID=A0A6G9YGH0_9NOCA|nr:hypothetical protein [Nocardia arthritidis]QIS12157.1 hypothetical protein F5544_21470 [Nocardia arthritidis]
MSAAPDNQNPDGPVTVSLGTPNFTKCLTDPSGGTATITSTADWALVLRNGSPITADLVIPKGGVIVTTSGSANCTTVFAPDESASVPGTYTNGVAGPITTFSSFTVNDYVPIRTTGDATCPTDTIERFSATFYVNDATDPGKPIIVGP